MPERKRINNIFKLNGNVYAFDSTTIDLCLKLFPWANWHYKIFCVNGNTGFRNESRIYYFIHLQNEKDYERKKSSSA